MPQPKTSPNRTFPGQISKVPTIDKPKKDATKKTEKGIRDSRGESRDPGSRDYGEVGGGYGSFNPNKKESK